VVAPGLSIYPVPDQRKSKFSQFPRLPSWI
jgi:hypothetical protein